MNNPTPEQVRSMRQAANLTQRKCAEIFGYGLRGWQKKETTGKNGRSLTIGEWNYLQLIAGKHPDFQLNPEFAVLHPPHPEKSE